MFKLRVVMFLLIASLSQVLSFTWGAESNLPPGVSNEPTRNSSEESMEAYRPVNPSIIFDRNAFLQNQIHLMMEELEDARAAIHIFKKCYIVWTMLAGGCSISSILISSMGAANYIDSHLANFLTVAISLGSAIFLWAAQQSNKISGKYYERTLSIQEALGVPSRLREKELKLEIEQFKKDG